MANYRDMAKVHARIKHDCPLCKRVVRGNGGWASHRRAHCRAAGMTEEDLRFDGLRACWWKLVEKEKRKKT